MNSTLEFDNEDLRRKLQDLRKTNSKLVSENLQLVEMLEGLGCELKSSSLRVQSLEESMESYRSKSKELSGMVSTFERASRCSEKDSVKFKQKYEECAEQLAESADILMHQSDTMQSLKDELEETKSLLQKTEVERDIALNTAEKIQKSHEDLQKKFKQTVAKTEDEAVERDRERRRLAEDLERYRVQTETLQQTTKTQRAEVCAQQNLRKDCEQRNSDLRCQLKNQSTKIEKLEEELDGLKSFKVKNGEMKMVLDKQRKRIATLETELRAARSELEIALRFSQRASIKSKGSMEATARTRSNGLGGGASIARTEEKIFSATDLFDFNESGNEIDLLQLKADILRWGCSVADTSAGNIAQILNPGQNELMTESFPEKHGHEIQHRILVAAAALEKRLSNFESLNARLVGHIAHLTSKIAQLQKTAEDQKLELATSDRECKKFEQQIALLGKQLEDKTQELSLQIAEVENLKSQVDQVEHDRVETLGELEEKCKERLQFLVEFDQLKQLHAEQCQQLTRQFESKEKQCEKLRQRLLLTETRCQALQQSLTQTIGLTDALKDDLHGCKQIQSKVLEQERKLQDAYAKTEGLEQERNSLKTNLTIQMQNFQSAVEQYQKELDAKSEHLEYLDDKLKRSEELNLAKDQEIRRLAKAEEYEKAATKEHEETIEKLKQERDDLVAQCTELQQDLMKETSVLESLLEISDEKLKQANADLGQKENVIEELRKRNENLVAENVNLQRLVSKLGESEKLLMEVENEQEKVKDAIEKQQTEIKLLKVLLKDRDETIEKLQGRLAQVSHELQEKTKHVKESFAEIELLKAGIHTRDSQMSEAERKVENLVGQIAQYGEQIEGMKLALMQNQKQLSQKQTEVEFLEEKLQEKELDLQQKVAAIRRLECDLDKRHSVLTESEQKLLRVRGALEENQLNAQQYEKKVANLEDQVHDLLAVVKEQCIQIRKDEETIAKLNAELSNSKTRAAENEKSLSDLRLELQQMMAVNKQAEEELGASRSHLQKMQHELIGSKQELTSVRSGHNFLAKDLAEAAVLLQQKDDELTKLLTTLTEAEELRARLKDQLNQAEEDYDRLKSCYDRDLANLKKVHEATMAVRDNEKKSLQQDLKEAVNQREFLKEQLKLRKLQMNAGRDTGCFDDSDTVQSDAGEMGLSVQQTPDFAASKHKAGDVAGKSTLNTRLGFSESVSGDRYSLSEDDENFESSSRQKQNVYSIDFAQNPVEDWSNSSGIHSCDAETDRGIPEVPIGENPTDFHPSSRPQSTSSPRDSVDRLGNDFMTQMWMLLRHSDVGDPAVSRGRSTPSDDSKASSVINVAAATECATVDSTPLTSSSVPVLQKGVSSAVRAGHSHQSKPDGQSQKWLKKIPSACEWKEKAPQPAVNTRISRTSSNSNVRESRERGLVKKPADRSRSLNSKSTSSPDFAVRNSPDLTTAVAYYDRFPVSNSDGEVERLFGDDGLYQKRFLSTD